MEDPRGEASVVTLGNVGDRGDVLHAKLATGPSVLVALMEIDCGLSCGRWAWVDETSAALTLFEAV